MQVQVNTDRHIKGHEKLAMQVREAAETALSHISDRITRVEVHLSDQNADKSGADDKRCVMEARLKGRRPVAVTHDAATLELAIDGAATKLSRSLERTLDKITDPRNHTAPMTKEGGATEI